MWHVAWVRGGRVMQVYPNCPTYANAGGVAATLALKAGDEAWIAPQRPRVGDSVAYLKWEGGAVQYDFLSCTVLCGVLDICFGQR